MDRDSYVNIIWSNIDPSKSQKISLNVNNEKTMAVSARILSSKKIQDYNSSADAEKIMPSIFTGATLSKNLLTITLPPASVVVLTLK